MADPFDEFEFKPLTEGLGFHKKAEKIKAEIKSSRFASEKLGRMLPEPPAGASSRRDSADLLSRASVTGELETRMAAQTEAIPTRSSASQSISDLIASLPPSLDFLEEKPESSGNGTGAGQKAKPGFGFSGTGATSDPRPQIFQPLGREDYASPASRSSLHAAQPTPALGTTVGAFLPPPGTKAGGSLPSIVASQAASNAGIPASPYREKLDESFARAFPSGESRTVKTKRESKSTPKKPEVSEEGLVAKSAHLGASLLDAMVAAGMTTILLVAILAITRINLLAQLTNPETQLRTQLNLGLLFIAVIEMYMLTARSLFTASLGEWAFDLQLGSDADQKSPWYPLQVAGRLFFVTISGFVLLPVLSLLTRRDLAKPLTGLQLYQRT